MRWARSCQEGRLAPIVRLNGPGLKLAPSLSLLLFGTLVFVPSPAAGSIESIPQIRHLEETLRTSSDPDSVRFALAIAYRNIGTVEGRLRALDLLQRLRTRFFRDVVYHLEVARTYLEGERYSDAREELERAIARAPEGATMRVMSARFLIPSIIRYRDLQSAREGLRVLDEALDRAPQDRDALFFKALYLCMLASLGMADRVESNMAARACTEEILSRDADDIPACLLNGVASMDLGDVVEADYSFRLGLTSAPDAIKIRYFVPTWSAPDSALARLESLSLEERVPAVKAYWDGIDPTPLTPVNEALLEYWKRLTLADLFFGHPEKRIHGWDTPRGEVLVRYGIPTVMSFKAAQFESGEATTQEDVRLNLRKAKIPVLVTMPLIRPTQTWRYRLAGRSVDIAFTDMGLNDDLQPSDPALLERLRSTIVSTPAWVSSGGIRLCYVIGAGRRGKASAVTRQSLIAGIPRWGSNPDWWRDGKCRISIVGSDSRRKMIQESQFDPGSIREALPGLSMTVVSADLDLSAGRYSAIVDIDAGDQHATFTFPVDVRRFDGDTLMISDLRFAFPGNPTELAQGMDIGKAVVANPTEAILAGGSADIYFEIYNLTKDRTGISRYQTRYTLLPREYAFEYARFLASGAGADPSLRFGGLGRTLGGVTLTRENYSDALFPPREARVAEDGVWTASAHLDRIDLDSGIYVLMVTVTDLSNDQVALAQTILRILSDSDLARLRVAP